MAGKFFYDGIKRIYGCGGVEKKTEKSIDNFICEWYSINS